MSTPLLFHICERDSFLNNELELLQFTTQLRDVGYAFVAIPTAAQEPIANVFKSSQDFFELPEVEKASYRYNQGVSVQQHTRKLQQQQQQQQQNQAWLPKQLNCNSVSRRILSCSTTNKTTSSANGHNQAGKYNNDRDPNPREYLDIVKNKNKLFPTTEMQSAFMNGYATFYDISIKLLEQLLYAIGGDFSYVESLLGPSHTKLRLLKYYYAGESDRETCNRHTDRGLLTVAVCRDYGLEVKHFDTNEWIDVERIAPKHPCLVVFAGEALSRLTGGYIKAVFHRVYTHSNRFSCPFFLRVRENAILDMDKVRSSSINQLVENGTLEHLTPIAMDALTSLVVMQYKTKSFPPQLGKFKSDSYWEFC